MLRTAALRTRVNATRIIGRRNASTNIAIQNIETRWKTLSTAEQNTIAKQLEEAQKGDWKSLSLDEKKAAYYIAFGAHGPREPLTKPGHGMKVLAGVTGVLAASGVLFYLIRLGAQETPKTVSREWQEATNEYLKSQNSNPVTGISSEGYKGTGYVTKF
ncbi:cytochrome c oxidase subunit IV [Cokeromyces recurvatus]|uniref:cytochrome c oxidase subunit IV n=1 Tax=Cokeromyces recurvatus TaxID=90255 RepID=UPI00221F80A6|nr:cytochrome c oxidase subunit IV [Cokeromyces recurvatus]KAI7901515.1 cytochrome c oxidase subunit IV [Cokeromyces recurvatus]